MLARRILPFIKKNGLFSPRDRVLVAVSGGPDSLALLSLLNELKMALGIHIIVAHGNHGLRGRASDSDERYVSTVSRRLGLDFVSKKISRSRKASRHPSEASLRSARLDFLFSTAKKYHVDKIAVGHTLDDQAETVLMRLIRGSGLYGLIAMMPKRRFGSCTIVRPLLGTARAEIERYLKKKRLTPRIDASNVRPIFLRNKIRHSLLKELVSLNPNIKQVLARFAEQAAIDYDFLFGQASAFVKKGKKASVVIDADTFVGLHEALQRMIIRVSLEKVAGSLRTFTYAHWDEIKALIHHRPQGSVVDVTKGIKVHKQGKKIIIYSAK